MQVLVYTSLTVITSEQLLPVESEVDDEGDGQHAKEAEGEAGLTEGGCSAHSIRSLMTTAMATVLSTATQH